MIAVLGASGRTGRVVAATLESSGQCAVRYVTRTEARLVGDHRRDVRVARLSEEAELGRALSGARAVFALLPDDLGSPAFHTERRAMVEAMTRAIRREGVPRVVLLSSIAATLGEAGDNGFGADLAYFERALRETTAQVTILRASYFQDNVAQVLPLALRDGIYPCLLTGATAMIAAVDVGRLAARALLQTASCQHEILDLVGPSYTPAETAAALGEVLRRRVDVVPVPASEQEAMLRPMMSVEAARAMVATVTCLNSGQIQPGGNREIRGETRLHEVLRTALAQRSAEEQELQS